jgi:hypothetical protein
MWSRALAGVVPGFFLAAAFTGLVAWGAPGPWQNALVPSLVFFVPTWIAILGGAFLFANGRRAWIALGTSAALAFVVLIALKTLGWVA